MANKIDKIIIHVLLVLTCRNNETTKFLIEVMKVKKFAKNLE